MQVKYNLPKNIIFCKKCTISNQRPSSMPEYHHTVDRKNAKYININNDGVCDACLQAEIKNNQINWEEREKDLLKLLEKHRKNNGDFDCLVPGSGGKDSAFVSHILKYKYEMNPLTVTWPPILYTDYGYKNFSNWIKVGGFDNISFNQNGIVQKILTKLSIENLLHPFQSFILGQKNLAPKIANEFNIDLVFYGENEAEYGNPIADNNISLRNKSIFTHNNIDNIYISGLSLKELKEKYNLDYKDLKIYLPLESNKINDSMEVHYMGYYIKWMPQSAYYYAVKNCNFQPRPFRTEGTYSKYNSIDDKIDDLHYYTTYIKFGIGRATYDSSQEIRNNHISREEACLLVGKYDGEYPSKYLKETLEYLDISENYFLQLCDKFRSPHIWTKKNDQWKLNHTVNQNGFLD